MYSNIYVSIISKINYLEQYPFAGQIISHYGWGLNYPKVRTALHAIMNGYRAQLSYFKDNNNKVDYKNFITEGWKYDDEKDL